VTACCPERAGQRGRPFTPHWFVVHDGDGAIDLGATAQLGGLPKSELECAVALEEMMAGAGRWIIHGGQSGRWYLWDGSGVYAPRDAEFERSVTEWAAQSHWQVMREVIDAEQALIARMPQDRQKAGGEAARKRWGKHLLLRDRIWSEAGQSALIKQLRRTCTRDEDAFNAGTGEIIVDNGRISCDQVLRDGLVRLLPHDRRRLVTKRTGKGVSWNPQAACPQFTAFLETSVPDPGQRGWLCWRLASALFGRMPRKGFLNLIGERDSGKSTLTETVALLAGGYAKTVAVETFLAKHAGDQGFLLHELMGARFVHTHEPRPGGTYDESFMKRLTGRDRMRTRTLYGKPVEWQPQCTPFIGSNGPIRFNTSDDAFMGRQEVVRFARGYEKPDEWLAERLRGELDGILAYLVRFIAAEGRHGVPHLPQSSVDDREAMADETEDALTFVTEWIEDGRLVVKHDVPVYRCAGVARLYAGYQMWCSEAGIHRPVGRKVFAAIVGRRYTRSRSGGSWHFAGLILTR
jgi:P4 family phage/plasmid primase-like protien